MEQKGYKFTIENALLKDCPLFKQFGQSFTTNQITCHLHLDLWLNPMWTIKIPLWLLATQIRSSTTQLFNQFQRKIITKINPILWKSIVLSIGRVISWPWLHFLSKSSGGDSYTIEHWGFHLSVDLLASVPDNHNHWEIMSLDHLIMSRKN